MTQQYSNENSGVLFKNKDKTDAHPTWADYEGSINVNGKDYYLSAWLKEAKSGVKYLSLSVKEKVSRQEAQADAAMGGGKDDGIPW